MRISHAVSTQGICEEPSWLAEDNIILIENGDVLELDGDGRGGQQERDRPYLHRRLGFEEIDSETVRQRKQMAYEGL